MFLKEVDTQGGGGGTSSYKKNWKLYLFIQKNAFIDIKISTIDIYLTNKAPKPKTMMFSLLHE